MRLFCLSVLIALLSLFSSKAQEKDQLLIRVIASDTKQPISYATIRFGDTQKGVVANEGGDFKLPLDFKLDNKTIIISSIGFETLAISVGNFFSHKVNEVYLKPKVEELEAVLILSERKNTTKGNELNDPTTAKEIVRNAIANIPENYPNQPHSYIGYYRDYQVVNNDYYNLNEGILESFDAGFNTNKYAYKDNNTALYSYNLNTNFNLDTLLLNSIYGKSKSIATDNSAKLGREIQNELEILNTHNPIRNFKIASFSFIYVLKHDFVRNHNFQISSIKYIEDEPLYEIDFVTVEDVNLRYVGSGKIFIAKSNYAIHKLEYGINDKGIGAERRRPFSNKYLNGENKRFFEVAIEYKAIGSKMFLNYMTFNNRFVIKEPKPFEAKELIFNTGKKNFTIVFNNPVDKGSIKKRSNFRLYFKGKKLIVSDIKLKEKNKVTIDVISWSAGEKVKIDEITDADFSFKLKRIKDTFGRVINKRTQFSGFQFREFFTQEVFEDKKLSSKLVFVDKSKPLSASKVNDIIDDLSKYWVNSPLKDTKPTQ
ncbi:carboxypeptidase-like regulatory domain-containing protein [Winogradskyella sp.]|uniref:carboxypeptidase-like regulatory domain-containing protein n=1 Tax=Winogradskyella sp. TaxID=1883156 RepID=UPI0026336047|nr:carboxypeptidase-like regulatory domain-containing protein [Winogradskyella sp.]